MQWHQKSYNYGQSQQAHIFSVITLAPLPFRRKIDLYRPFGYTLEQIRPKLSRIGQAGHPDHFLRCIQPQVRPLKLGMPNSVQQKAELPAPSAANSDFILTDFQHCMSIVLENQYSKSTEAQQQLVFLHTLEKNNFYTYSKYSASLEELGFEQQPLVTDGGHANYRIEIVEASERGFRATATAVVDFDGDGEYNVWEIDQDKNLKETVKD